jgi:hypothetical protein
MNPILDAFALKIMENPNTYGLAKKSGRFPWDAVRESVVSVDDFLNKPVTNPGWNMPALALALVNWASEDAEGYAAFLSLIAPEDQQRTLTTLPGLWMLHTVLNGLSDDHDYVLDVTNPQFRLARQGQVFPFQRLVNPTELTQSILAHRGLPALAAEPTPDTLKSPHGRRSHQP